MKTSLIVTLADKNYINYAKQLFSSVYFNAGWKGDYMLLAHEVPPEDLIWFKNKGIFVKECSPINMEKLAGTFPISSLNKFYLFTPEFKKWDNVVFLDTDIIVRSSLDELSELKGFWACRDGVGVNMGYVGYQFDLTKRNEITKQLKKKYAGKTPAFNSGVMAFNTDIITDTTFDELLYLGKKYEGICVFAEQSILNLYFYKKWNKLNFLYNFIVSVVITFYRQRVESFDPVIIHFCGTANKPWSPLSPHHNEWLKNFKRSELIDLAKRPDGIIDKHFLIKSVWYRLKFMMYRPIVFNLDLSTQIDRQVGQIGIILKSKYPTTYYTLRKLLFIKR